MLTEQQVLDEFRASDALLEGHFILSSGRHSPVFLQKMLVFQDPARTERLCRALALLIRERFGAVDLIVSPAMGGVIPGYETARALGCRAVFVDDGATLNIQAGTRVIGDAVRVRLGLQVDLSEPDLELHIEVDHKEMLVSCERLRGAAPRMNH